MPTNPVQEVRHTGIYSEAALLGAPSLRTDGPHPKIVGYAAVFNQYSEPLWGGFREIIRPGAFRDALKEGQDVRGLVDHDPSKILGRTKAGTMRLEEDSKGLRYEIDPPDTTIGRDVIVSLRRGDLDQSSFGFRLRKSGDKWSEEGAKIVREILAVDLFDVSVVTYPAYPQTSVAVRSLWPGSEESNLRQWIGEQFAPADPNGNYRRRLRLAELT